MESVHNVNVHPVGRMASALAGGLLAMSGARKKSVTGGLLMLAGGELLRRGVTGHCYLSDALGINTAPESESKSSGRLPAVAQASVTIDKPREELFRFWRNLENLPRFMRKLDSVTQTDQRRSHWVARGPLKRKLEWDAEVYRETPGEIIAWRSLPGATVENMGTVEFKPAPGNRGTEIHVRIEYKPGAGQIGEFAANLLGRIPKEQIQSDLGRLKQYLEGGEVATTEGQPKGPKSPRGPKAKEILARAQRSHPVTQQQGVVL